ncbi:MAG: N-acetylneuraminate synthase family protein [Pseudomonadota bacterium]
MSELVIIAEAGVNHKGDLSRARDMVDCAAKAGADYINFQAFSTDHLIAKGTGTAAYQSYNTGQVSQSDLLRGLEVDTVGFTQLALACQQSGIGFMATAFDIEIVEALLTLGMDKIKIASGELTNAPALIRFAQLGCPILLSTGMASLDEVGDAVQLLQDNGVRDITLLQCTSLYPAPAETLNLRAMTTMGQTFQLPVGFSDHSLGDHASIAAVALGACVIEKHFTLDRTLPGPDHAASLEPAELTAMIRKLRDIASMLGSGEKVPNREEAEVAALVRRSWHAAHALEAGTVLSQTDVVLKRPAHGLAPSCSPIGRTIRRDMAADEAIRSADISQQRES